jgi:hypothetical protein
VGYRLPPPGKESRRGRILEKTPTARFQTAHADPTALLAEEVVALATGTACAATRKRDEASSKSKHDDRSSRTSYNTLLHISVGQ